MELPRVGAFTDFGGSGYRNPVHFLAHFPDFYVILGFVGLVYYTGTLPGVGLKFSFVLGKWLLVTGYFTPEVD